MGRQPWSDRHTVEECKSFSISGLSRDGVFEKGPFINWTTSWTNAAGQDGGSISFWVRGKPPEALYLELSYTITNPFTEEKTPVDNCVDLVRTRCNFGGFRYWFICPLVVNGNPCMRRASKLYLPPGDRYFGCRHCHNLTYRSQKEHNKRIDILVKNPHLIEKMLQSPNPSESLLGLRAYFKLTGRL